MTPEAKLREALEKARPYVEHDSKHHPLIAINDYASNLLKEIDAALALPATEIDEDTIRRKIIEALDPFYPNPMAQCPLVVNALTAALTESK